MTIAWWEQTNKVFADIDELRGTETIQFLTPSEFWAIADRESQTAEVRQLQAQYRQLTYPVTRELNQRYLPDLVLPKPGSFLCISSPMGTGKSTVLVKLIQQFREQFPDRKIRNLGYRNGLLRQFGERAEIDLVHDLNTDDRGLSNQVINDADAVGLCVDSLLRLNLKTLDGALIILDEVDAILKHLLLGRTLTTGLRPQILLRFQTILQHVLSTGGYVIGSEANLTDLTLNTLRQIVGPEVEFQLIVNRYLPTPWEITVFQGSVSGLIEEIVNGYHQGRKQAIATDFQGFAEELEREFCRLISTAKVLRVDSTSSEQPLIQELLTHPDQVIEREQPDLFIYTPTIESGMDATTTYFDRLIFYFTHLETRAQLQMLGRFRAPIPRLGLVRERAIENNGDTQFLYASQIEQNLRRTATVAEELLHLAIALVNLDHEDAGDWLFKLNNLLDPSVKSEERFWITAACQYQARQNCARFQLRTGLIEALQEIGHQVDCQGLQPVKYVQALQKQINLELRQEEALKLFQAEDHILSVAQALKILSSNSSSEEQLYQARKVLLRDRLPGIEFTQEFLLKAVVESNGWFLRTTTLLWYLYHPSAAQDFDRRQFYSHFQQPFIYLPDLRFLSPQIDLLQRLNLLALIADREYRETDADMQQLRQRALELRWEIRQILGLNINDKQTAIQILSKFLKKLGYLLTSRKEGPRGEQVRVWHIENLEDDDRRAILTAMDRKYSQAAIAETNPSPSVSTIFLFKPLPGGLATFPNLQSSPLPIVPSWPIQLKQQEHHARPLRLA